MVSNSVLIKYVTVVPTNSYEKNCTKNQKQRRETAACSDYGSSCSGSGSEDTIVEVPKGRKRRLDHLTWEEKIMRKKLKNRVAAQTSRDRKKARMEEMETEIKELKEKTQYLQNECANLRKANESVIQKNNKLDEERQALQKKCAELESRLQKRPVPVAQTCANCVLIQNGSAVSTDPLQQGTNMKPQLTQVNIEQKLKKASLLAALWRIIAVCLIFKIFCLPMTTNSIVGNSKSTPKAYSPIFRELWKQRMERLTKTVPKKQRRQSLNSNDWWGPQQSAWNPAELGNQE